MIVFAGGVSLANSALTDMYNNTLAKWTPGPPLSIARRALTGVTWGTKLYFIGGFALAESGGACTRFIKRICIPCFYPRFLCLFLFVSLHLLALLNQSLFSQKSSLVFSPVHSLSLACWRSSPAVDIFDVPTKTVTSTSLSYARASPAAAAVNGFIVVGPGAVTPSRVIDIYNTVTRTWRQVRAGVFKQQQKCVRPVSFSLLVTSSDFKVNSTKFPILFPNRCVLALGLNFSLCIYPSHCICVSLSLSLSLYLFLSLYIYIYLDLSVSFSLSVSGYERMRGRSMTVTDESRARLRVGGLGRQSVLFHLRRRQCRAGRHSGAGTEL
jgi:hypothetical protein